MRSRYVMVVCARVVDSTYDMDIVLSAFSVPFTPMPSEQALTLLPIIGSRILLSWQMCSKW